MNQIPETFDFTPFGEAIKDAREKNGLTREALAEQLDITPRYLQSIEKEGQQPRFMLFIQLITMFDISVDQYIFDRNLKQIFNLSFHISANGDKSWILRLFRHLSYREILGISLCFSA